MFADAVGAGLHDRTSALVQRAEESSSTALPESLATRFEQSLGTDLSGVRVHTGEASSTAARSMSARAFATGQSIHFGAGQYDPSSSSGQQLIAHEVAHTVQQRGVSSSAQQKLEVSTPGDACEVEADVAAAAMVTGAPAAVRVGSASGIARWLDAGMDGATDASMDASVAPDVDRSMDASAGRDASSAGPPAPLVSISAHPRNWFSEAQLIASGLADDSAMLSAGSVAIGTAPLAILSDPAFYGGWEDLQQKAHDASTTWEAMRPRLTQYLALPTDFRIPGGGGVELHEVTTSTTTIDSASRTRAFDDPDFQAQALQLRAAEHMLTASVAEASAAAADVRAANQGLERVSRTAEAHQAAARRDGAEGRRADAAAGRSAELARIQNYIRVAEVGVGILIGGAGVFAAGSAAVAAGGAAVAPTVGGSLGTAAMTTGAGIGSNGLHDLAVGALAECFVSGQWDLQIRDAERQIETAVRQIQAASNAADRAAIDEQLAHQEAANLRMTAASQRLTAAHETYRSQLMHLASAAGHGVGGTQGRRMQAALASLLPVQARLARLGELEGLVQVPSYTEGSGWAYALIRSDELGPTMPGDQFVNLVARLLFLRESFLPREITQWRARERAINALISTIAPDDGRDGR